MAMRPQKPPKKKTSFKIKDLLKPVSLLDWLLLGAVGLFVALGSYLFYDRAASPLAVHDNAACFAAALRDASVTARDRASPVRVRVYPSSPRRPSYYTVSVNDNVEKTENFSMGVSSSGDASFDPQGVPIAPTVFIFRKGPHRAEVNLDIRGVVSMPVQP